MSVLPVNTLLGKLKIIEVFDWLDGPRLFIAENASGHRYLAFWAGDQGRESLWFYAPASETRVANLVAGKIDLRTVYTQPEDGILFSVRITQDGQSIVEPIVPARLDLDLLPASEDVVTPDDAFFVDNRFVGTDDTPLTHQITINRPRSNTPIAFESLAFVAAHWSKLIHTVLQLPPVLTSVSTGSLTIELQTTAGQALPAFFKRLHDLIHTPTAEQINNTFNLQEYRELELVLEFLYQDKLTLSATLIPAIRSETEPSSPQVEPCSLALSPATVKELRTALIDFKSQTVESTQVPQADDLNKLFSMLELLKDGEVDLSYHLSLSPRHVNYYKQAGRILDLLSEHDSLTSRGLFLLGLSELERYDVAMLLFESSPIGFAWLRYCGVQSALKLDPESARDFLRSHCSNLSEATLGRRAQTLKYWVIAFQTQLKE